MNVSTITSISRIVRSILEGLNTVNASHISRIFKITHRKRGHIADNAIKNIVNMVNKLRMSEKINVFPSTRLLIRVLIRIPL